MANERLIGKNIQPPDLYAKITGRAKYAEDFRADGMLFTKILASPMPHARVTRIDTTAALAMDGVEAVLLPEDLPETDPLGEPMLTMEPLYEGAPILAVAAISEQLAADAIEKIRMDIEPLPFVVDPMDSLAPGGPNARVGGNVMMPKEEGSRERVLKELKWTQADFDAVAPDQLPLGEAEEEWSDGDLEAAFAEAAFTVDETIFHQSLTHHPMEPRSCFSYWRGDRLFVHPSTQSTQRTVGAVARQVGIDPSQVVLIAEYCGGGFGSKIGGTINMGISALLAKKTGRPVMQRVTRAEENYIGRARPGFQARIKMGWNKQGKVTAIDSFIVQDNGPFGRSGDISSAGRCLSLMYTPKAIRCREISVLTNTPPRAAQRAPGGMQVAAMVEPLMDKAAKALGIDQLAMRRINVPDNDTIYGSRQHGVTGAYNREACDKAAEVFGWEEYKKASGRRNGSKITGVGVGFGGYVAGSSGFDGLLVLRPDGKLYIHQGIGNLGTHSIADTGRIAAEILDLSWDKVEIVWGNTGKHLPFSSVQAGSQTIHAHTRANHAAATAMKRTLQELAAEVYGGSPDGYTTTGGRVHRKGAPRSGMSFAEAAQKAVELGGKFDGHELPEDINEFTKTSATALAGAGMVVAAKDNYSHDGDSWSFALGFAQVEVDLETGSVQIKDYKVIADVGTVVHPRGVAAQLHGGGIQGFGAAMSQKWVFDPEWGVPFAKRFYTARPPTMLEVPYEHEMGYDAVGIPDPQNPVGAKGVGEAAICTGAATVLCAIQDAIGEIPYNRTPTMTDLILDKLEELPRPFKALKAHV